MNKNELKWHFKGLSKQDRRFRFLMNKTDFLIDEWIDGVSDFSDWIVEKDGESIVSVGRSDWKNEHQRKGDV